MTLFPYFGSKRKAAADVWALLGADAACYVEPFAGSLAVLLNRPAAAMAARCEAAVDLDGLIINFWRAIRDKPGAVMRYVTGPVAEVEVDAWHLDLLAERDGLTKAMRDDPTWSDPQRAAWWWMGISSWLGSGWCTGRDGERPGRGRPHIDRTLKGAYAKGLDDRRVAAVAARLANVILLAGDWEDAWKRPLSQAIIERFKRDRVAVFLDPPYSAEVTTRQANLYHADTALSERVAEWALAQPEHVAIVVAGYRSEYPTLVDAGWRIIDWKAPNGYAAEANERRNEDVLIASPSCQKGTLW